MNENLTVLVESGHHVAPVREDPHADENHNLILLCQIKILASDHVGKYNVMC